MAYENYRFISWSSGTPITGARLAQMSTNIEQVKLATDDRPQGIIKYSKLTSLQTYAAGDVAQNTLVNLRDDTPSGSDNRVSADANRFVRLMVTFPGIKITARGAEDTRYEITIFDGLDTDPSPVAVAKYYLNPHLYAFYDVATNGASTTTIDPRSGGNDVYFGAGSYSTVLDTSTSGWTNKNFFVAVKRIANSDMTNSPGYTVMSSSGSPLEFYAEDIGGTS